jgi:hypothetical protein
VEITHLVTSNAVPKSNTCIWGDTTRAVWRIWMLLIHWRKYIKHQIFLINILIVEKTKLPRSNMLIEKILYWKYTNTPSCKFFFKGKLFFKIKGKNNNYIILINSDMCLYLQCFLNVLHFFNMVLLNYIFILSYTKFKWKVIYKLMLLNPFQSNLKFSLDWESKLFSRLTCNLTNPIKLS